MAPAVKPDPAQDEAAKGPQLNPLEQAIADARARKKDNESILPEADTEETTTEDTETTETVAKETEDKETEATDKEKTDEDGEEEDETGTVAAEGGENEKDETEDGSEPSKSEDGEEAEGGEEEVDPELVVPLPARREGEEALEIVVENKEVAERLRQLQNGFERGEQIREREEIVARDQQQIEELEVFIGTDPVGFIEQNVPKEVAETVALSLVMQHMASKTFTDRLLPALQDEKERRTLTAELGRERAEAKGRLNEVIEVRRFAKVQAKTIRETIELMVPDTESISGERREAIKETLEKAVGAVIREKKLEKVEPDDLPVLLLKPLRAAGIDPTAAGQAIKSGKRITDSEAGSKTSPKKKVKQPTAAELKKSSVKRKKAAASAPPGAAAPATRPKLPSGQGLEERFAEIRKRGGLGAVMSGAT
jgi:hypothetical protein